MAPRLAVWGALVGIGVGVGALACGGKGAVAARPCTMEARASVTVQVVDSKGQARPDARVSFTLDGGAAQQAQCNGGSPEQGDCASWVTNYETAGAYVVTATSADGQRSAQERVTVGRDECHVQGQTLTLVLPD